MPPFCTKHKKFHEKKQWHEYPVREWKCVECEKEKQMTQPPTKCPSCVAPSAEDVDFFKEEVLEALSYVQHVLKTLYSCPTTVPKTVPQSGGRRRRALRKIDKKTDIFETLEILCEEALQRHAAQKPVAEEVTVDLHLLDKAVRCLRTAVWRSEDIEQGYQMHPENLRAAKEVIYEYEESEEK